MPKTPAERVDWRLHKLPDLQVGYEAVSACPHGESAFAIFGRVGPLLSQVEGLLALHVMEAGCRCRLGRVVIDGLVVVDGGEHDI